MTKWARSWLKSASTSTLAFSNRKQRVGTYDKQVRSLPQCRINAGSDLFLSVRSSPTTHFVTLRVMNEIAGGWFDGAWSSSANEDLGRPAHSGSVLRTAGIYKKWSDISYGCWSAAHAKKEKKKKLDDGATSKRGESQVALCCGGFFVLQPEVLAPITPTHKCCETSKTHLWVDYTVFRSEEWIIHHGVKWCEYFLKTTSINVINTHFNKWQIVGTGVWCKMSLIYHLIENNST